MTLSDSSKISVFPLILTAFLIAIPVCFQVAFAEVESNASSVDMSGYSDEVQARARQIVRPGMISRMQRVNVRRRISKWQRQAKACNESVSVTEEFYSDACRTFAFSTRYTKIQIHEHNCDNIASWKQKKISRIEENLMDKKQSDPLLEPATGLALKLLEGEIDSLCNYQPILVLDNPLAANYVAIIRPTLRRSAGWRRAGQYRNGNFNDTQFVFGSPLCIGCNVPDGNYKIGNAPGDREARGEPAFEGQ